MAMCHGKHRDVGNATKAWVDWNGSGQEAPVIEEIEVEDEYYMEIRMFH